MQKPPSLRAKPEMYTLQNIRKHWDVWTPDEVRAAYTKYAAQANKRLETMAKTTYGRESETYLNNVGRFLPADQLTTGEQKVLLSDAARMLTSELGSLNGLRRVRKKKLEELHASGYDFITYQNLAQFGRFMAAWRSSGEQHVVGSAAVAELFPLWSKSKLDSADLLTRFEEFVEAERAATPAQRLSGHGARVASAEFREKFAATLPKGVKK